jgi:hypothetical protein
VGMGRCHCNDWSCRCVNRSVVRKWVSDVTLLGGHEAVGGVVTGRSKVLPVLAGEVALAALSPAGRKGPGLRGLRLPSSQASLCLLSLVCLLLTLVYHAGGEAQEQELMML